MPMTMATFNRLAIATKSLGDTIGLYGCCSSYGYQARPLLEIYAVFEIGTCEAYYFSGEGIQFFSPNI